MSLLGKGDVDIDVFRTVLTQAESILNGRPLTSVSSDAADPLPLTPAHFLHLSVDAFDDPTLLQFEAAGTESLRYSYNKSINLVRGLWKRWKGEYVSSLKNRAKWHITKPDVQIGQVVLLADELKERKKWKLARVVAAQGSDDRVRTVKVRTSNGRILSRDVSKLVPLEFDILN